MSTWDGRNFWNGDIAIPLPESALFLSVVSFLAILQRDGIIDPKLHIEELVNDLRQKKKLMTAELDEPFADSVDFARIEVDKDNVWVCATFLEALCFLRYGYAILIEDVRNNKGDVGNAQFYLGRQIAALTELEGKFLAREKMLGNEVAFVKALFEDKNVA
jgi:hypothetical protein